MKRFGVWDGGEGEMFTFPTKEEARFAFDELRKKNNHNLILVQLLESCWTQEKHETVEHRTVYE